LSLSEWRETLEKSESFSFVSAFRQLIMLRWFGLILLPLVSFAGDGFVAIFYFVQSVIHHFTHQPAPPAVLAKARAIDLSIQFTLFWMPFLVLLGWWTGRPMHLLFGTPSSLCVAR
jgi:Ca2+:H+ antiporter